MNALPNGTTVTGASVRVIAGGTPLGNFDAFGSAHIQTKPGGPFFVRPAGSGNGVKALRASITGALQRHRHHRPGGHRPLVQRPRHQRQHGRPARLRAVRP